MSTHMGSTSHTTSAERENPPADDGSPAGEWSLSFKHENGMAIVIDPATRKMQVPLAALMPTKAVHRQGIPSLCLLFIAGRCRQGSSCHQVHCDPSVVEVLRTASAAVPTCCLTHGDINASRMHPTWLDRELVVQGIRIPLRQVGFTKGGERIMTDHIALRGAACTDPIPVDTALVCRQHGTGSCRYSEDCKFLHPCQKIVTQQLAAFIATAPPDRKQAPSLQHHSLHHQLQSQQQQPMLVSAAPQSHMQMFTPMLQHMAPMPMPMQPTFYPMMPQMMMSPVQSPFQTPHGSIALGHTPTMQLMAPMGMPQQQQQQPVYVLVPSTQPHFLDQNHFLHTPIAMSQGHAPHQFLAQQPLYQPVQPVMWGTEHGHSSLGSDKQLAT